MYFVDLLEQGARFAISSSADFEFLQWEKSGVIEEWREKNYYGSSKEYDIYNAC